LPKKINAGSDQNPVLVCNAVQRMKAYRLRAPFTHATAATTKKKKKKELQRVNQHYPSARSPTAEMMTVLSAPYPYSMAL
jgi:hypothetical protein